MSVQRLVPLNLPVLSTLPTGNRRTGDLVYYSVDSKVYVFDGTNWTIASGSGGSALSSSLPLADGTAAAGSSTDASRSDHVHPETIHPFLLGI